MKMDAIKFFKEKKRMCKSLGEGCTGCMIHIKIAPSSFRREVVSREF